MGGGGGWGGGWGGWGGGVWLGFFFNDTATTEIYTLSLHDALPISGVVLSTVHSAKGLEWNNVFIIALSDGSLPVSYVLEDDEGLEEECRLLYVAITRAKTNLYLTMHNESRNNGMYAFNKLCRFLNIKSVLKKIDVNHNFEEEDSFDYNQDRQSSNPFYTKSSLYRKIKDNFFEEEYI